MASLKFVCALASVILVSRTTAQQNQFGPLPNQFPGFGQNQFQFPGQLGGIPGQFGGLNGQNQFPGQLGGIPGQIGGLNGQNLQGLGGNQFGLNQIPGYPGQNFLGGNLGQFPQNIGQNPFGQNPFPGQFGGIGG